MKEYHYSFLTYPYFKLFFYVRISVVLSFFVRRNAMPMKTGYIDGNDQDSGNCEISISLDAWDVIHCYADC